MSTFRSKLNLSILIRKRQNPGLGLREICRIVWGVPGPGETERFYSTFQRRWTEAVEGYHHASGGKGRKRKKKGKYRTECKKLIGGYCFVDGSVSRVLTGPKIKKN